VHKHLQRHGELALLQLSLKSFQILEGQLPCHHHPFAAGGGGLSHTGGAGDGHLGGRMQTQLRNQLLRQQTEP